MSIAIVGNDERQKRLLNILKSKGKSAFLTDNLNSFDLCDTVILPLPLTRDNAHVNTAPDIELSELAGRLIGKRVFFGKGTPVFEDALVAEGVEYYDYNKSELFQYENARITAEACISLAISELPFSLYKSSAVVVGFGRIGKHLCRYLSLFGADVTVFARRDTDIAYAASLGYATRSIDEGLVIKEDDSGLSGTDIIMNTAPAKIFTKENSVPFKNAVAFDLAGGDSMSEFVGEVIPALGLPAKYSPASASLALYNSIKEKL